VSHLRAADGTVLCEHDEPHRVITRLTDSGGDLVAEEADHAPAASQ